ncbi:uncharacterized protein Z518_09012 [Rhinocladiella mackenziei CBS 650.93]|uniref:Uncharacterized protein n=1 Tax=Rhinocladiella mackenziei CBS 650.93 TaxID=1442369 RepID=A0A0D2FGX6_9EURO|nr:uncharacterized protein Z518_09012 [Rhinocladiella mackenziei CBS 650.93]KIX01287.1 hypothetical protein Z518_09012 [Rhinocladiella mackenziei CBS 650.93]
MQACELFTIWAAAILLANKFLVTALPPLSYVWLADATELFDGNMSDGDNADEIYAYDPLNLAIHPHETGRSMVKVPATVYPHDTSPTATSGDDTTGTVTEHSTLITTAARPHLQLRSPNPNPNDLVPDASPSIQSLESIVPITTSRSLAVECGGGSECPPGYVQLLVPGMCYCRLLPSQNSVQILGEHCQMFKSTSDEVQSFFDARSSDDVAM